MGQGGCPLGSHLLPLRKVTSSSATSGSPSPAVVPQWPDGGSLGVHLIPYAQPLGSGPPLLPYLEIPKVPKIHLKLTWALPSGWGL